APGAGHPTTDEADVVGHVGGERWEAEEEQRREGDQGAGPDDGVDGARRQPSEEDPDGFEDGHHVTLATARPHSEHRYAAHSGERAAYRMVRCRGGQAGGGFGSS